MTNIAIAVTMITVAASPSTIDHYILLLIGAVCLVNSIVP